MDRGAKLGELCAPLGIVAVAALQPFDADEQPREDGVALLGRRGRGDRPSEGLFDERDLGVERGGRLGRGEVASPRVERRARPVEHGGDVGNRPDDPRPDRCVADLDRGHGVDDRFEIVGLDIERIADLIEIGRGGCGVDRGGPLLDRGVERRERGVVVEYVDRVVRHRAVGLVELRDELVDRCEIGVFDLGERGDRAPRAPQGTHRAHDRVGRVGSRDPGDRIAHPLVDRRQFGAGLGSLPFSDRVLVDQTAERGRHRVDALVESVGLGVGEPQVGVGDTAYRGGGVLPGSAGRVGGVDEPGDVVQRADAGHERRVADPRRPVVAVADLGSAIVVGER